MISDVPFIHRKNPNSTHDSICMTCFLTVATADNEADLKNEERAHNCERAIETECRQQLKRASWLSSPLPLLPVDELPVLAPPDFMLLVFEEFFSFFGGGEQIR
jgi:hypothetical protein